MEFEYPLPGSQDYCAFSWTIQLSLQSHIPFIQHPFC
jgi:hypothetical protein